MWHHRYKCQLLYCAIVERAIISTFSEGIVVGCLSHSDIHMNYQRSVSYRGSSSVLLLWFSYLLLKAPDFAVSCYLFYTSSSISIPANFSYFLSPFDCQINWATYIECKFCDLLSIFFPIATYIISNCKGLLLACLV